MNYSQMSASQQGSALNRMLTPLLEKGGYVRRKAKNTEGAQITEIEGHGHVRRVVYKTSRGRWFSMHPSGDSGWKPLDGTDGLALVTVDDPEVPTEFQLYIFTADEVRQHLNAGKTAWTSAGVQIGGFGLWLSLDLSEKAHHIPGSGLAQKRSPEATIPINAEGAPTVAGEVFAGQSVSQPTGEATAAPKTIAGVLSDARKQIATIAGVAVDAVRLDLHIGA